MPAVSLRWTTVRYAYPAVDDSPVTVTDVTSSFARTVAPEGGGVEVGAEARCPPHAAHDASAMAAATWRANTCRHMVFDLAPAIVDCHVEFTAGRLSRQRRSDNVA